MIIGTNNAGRKEISMTLQAHHNFGYPPGLPGVDAATLREVPLNEINVPLSESIAPRAEPDIVLLLSPVSRFSPRTRYRIGGLTVDCDVPLDVLAPFTLDRNEHPMDYRVSTRLPTGTTPVFKDECWIGGSMHTLECDANAQQTHLRVPGLDDLVVHRGRPTFIRRVGTSTSTDVVLGPGLIFALALQGVFTLHASAALTADGGGIVGFLGASGSGKSTLAAAFGNLRAADDILPIGWELGGVVAYPHYPQLKLPPQAQWTTPREPKMPVRAFFFLHPTGPADPVRCKALTATEAVVALVRNTVAARLFSGDLLDHHLSACADFALNLRTFSLEVPHDLSRLPEVQAAIESHLP